MVGVAGVYEVCADYLSGWYVLYKDDGTRRLVVAKFTDKADANFARWAFGFREEVWQKYTPPETNSARCE